MTRGPIAGGITTLVPHAHAQPEQWPALVGYSAFFAACCLAGALGGFLVEHLKRR